MGWIFLVASQETQSACDPTSKRSLTVNMSDTHKLSFFHECLTVTSKQHPSGMMLQPSQKIPSTCLSISSPQDSLAKIHPLEENNLESGKEKDQGCSTTLRDLRESWNLSLSSWKTSTVFCPAAELMSWKKLPPLGSISDGVFYQPQMSVPSTEEKGGSVWLIGDVKVTSLPTPNTMDHLSLRSEDALKKKFQTTRKGRKGLDNLREAVHPECYPSNLFSGKNCYENAMKRGKLNPMFLEILMGFPIKWTELNDLGMRWFQNKLK